MPVKKSAKRSASARGPAFWLVWRESGGSPTYRHESEKDARAEAERLARRDIGARYYVLPASAYVAAEATMNWNVADGLNAKQRRQQKRHPDNEPPF